MTPTEAAQAMREAGWSVAVHNDYRLDKQPMTFWLWTHPNGRWIKGEGVTDAEALTSCLDALPLPEATPDPRDEALKLAREGLEIIAGKRQWLLLGPQDVALATLSFIDTAMKPKEGAP